MYTEVVIRTINSTTSYNAPVAGHRTTNTDLLPMLTGIRVWRIVQLLLVPCTYVYQLLKETDWKDVCDSSILSIVGGRRPRTSLGALILNLASRISLFANRTILGLLKKCVRMSWRVNRSGSGAVLKPCPFCFHNTDHMTIPTRRFESLSCLLKRLCASMEMSSFEGKYSPMHHHMICIRKTELTKRKRSIDRVLN